ncbi:hypothetical protein P7C70_g8293, partial [Phenoliferia sp. Uapishka_3]
MSPHSLSSQRILSCEECLLPAVCCDLDADSHHASTSSHLAPLPVNFRSPHAPSTIPLAFCCDEPDCLPQYEACDGGPTCPSASFVGWGEEEDCEACVGVGGAGGKGKGKEMGGAMEEWMTCCDEDCFVPDAGADCAACCEEGLGEGRNEEQMCQDILDCCCQSHLHLEPPIDPSLSHTDPHLSHSLLPNQPQQSTSTHADFLSVLPTILAFPCRWSDCNLSFSTKDDLASHVNGDHLAEPQLPKPEVLVNSNISQKLPEGSTPFAKCLWNECTTSSDPRSIPSTLPWAIPSAPLNAAQTPSDTSSLLLKHLLDEHLSKLEPALALAWTSSLLPKALLPQPEVSTSHLTPFSPTPSTPSTPIFDASIESPVLSPPEAHVGYGHSHSYAYPHPHPHPHPHSHSHAQSKSHQTSTATQSVIHANRHLLSTHRHHGHPYSLHPRLPTQISSSSPPIPSATGSHSCRWKDCVLSFETSSGLMNHLSVDHVGSGKANYV